MKLSIISTLYKSEPYIRKCLNSLLNQDIPADEYELIIVDDGSPDACVDIIREEYLPRFHNIVLVHQENKGLPEARNTGLYNAHGEYITFVDPDDYVETNIFGGLLKEIENRDLDLLRYNYTMRRESDYQELPKYKESLLTVDYSSGITNGQEFLGDHLGFACYVWQFLFKRSLFINNNILFREKVFDDADVLPRILLHVNKVSSVNTIVYNYVQRDGSLVNVMTEAAARKKIYGFLYIIERYNEYFSLYDYPNAKKWLRSSVTSAIVGILQTAALYDFKNRTEYSSAIHSINSLPLSSYNRFRKKRIHNALLTLLGYNKYCELYHFIHKEHDS